MTKAILAVEQYLCLGPIPSLIEVELETLIDAVSYFKEFVIDNDLAEVRVNQFNGVDIDDLVKWHYLGEEPALCGSQLVVSQSMSWIDSAVDQDDDMERPFRTCPLEVFEWVRKTEHLINETNNVVVIETPLVTRLQAEPGVLPGLAKEFGFTDFVVV